MSAKRTTPQTHHFLALTVTVYVGQTKRGLKSRFADHRRATSQLRPKLSALCKHAMDFNHTIDWEKSEILKVENNYSKQLISEAWFINAHPKVMNSLMATVSQMFIVHWLNDFNAI